MSLKIYIQKIPYEGTDIDATLEPTVLGKLENDLTILSPLKLHGHIEKSDEQLIATFEVAGKYGFACARCLDVIEEERQDTFELFADITPATEFVDFTNDIREEIIIELTSVFVLCKDDCKGLCPNCGVNLNHQSCVCPPHVKAQVHIKQEDEVDDNPTKLNL